ncbi:MAG: hypothetical protein BroJett040_24130 [Oligoflexia bacterium]|nr:MAG: hypothetical protein BroJett040_24130 [Oligoflexia bacterium]
MGKYEIKVDKATPQYKVTISGVVDEDIDFNAYSLSGAASVDLQLGMVKSINSCGIREWIKWIGTAGTAPVKYHQCPKIIVDQINMVQGFLPASGKVMSFYVPYYNEDSGSEKNVLFTYGKEFTDSAVNPPAAVKDDEGNVMEMDVVEAKYFKFIKK